MDLIQIKFNNFTGWRIENSTAEKDLWVLVHERLDLTWQCAFAVHEVNHILGWTRRRAVQQDYGSNSSLSFSWDLTWNTESNSDVLSIGMMCTCRSESRGDDWRDEISLLWGKSERVGVVQPAEEKALGKPPCSLWVLKITLWDRGGQIFSQGLLQ